jgi:hypothetical protein
MPRIHIAPAGFEPWKIQAVTHALIDHPLLQIDALVELGRRQQASSIVSLFAEISSSKRSDHCHSLRSNGKESDSDRPS